MCKGCIVVHVWMVAGFYVSSLDMDSLFTCQEIIKWTGKKNAEITIARSKMVFKPELGMSKNRQPTLQQFAQLVNDEWLPIKKEV